MDPQSLRALIIVVIVGSMIVAIGTAGLFLVFRKYGEPQAGGGSHKTLIAALLAFIFLCCLGLVTLAYSDR
jgi:cbb3-type cytochrome oxidase subunit 3